MSLIGFRNRLLVMIEWAWAYVTFNRGVRLFTGPTGLPGRPARTAEPPERPVHVP
jgi:NADH dehydrogenase